MFALIGLLGDCCNPRQEYPSTSIWDGTGVFFMADESNRSCLSALNARGVDTVLADTYLDRGLKKTGAPQKETGV